MARIRTIKPEFWTSEQVVECSTIARLMFIGIWNFCDDGGVHPASPKRLKMEVFPGDDFTINDIEQFVAELMVNKLVVEFSHDGKTYWQVTGWKKHQKIDRPTYRYPQPQSETPKDQKPNSEQGKAEVDPRKNQRGLDDNSTSNNRDLDEFSPPEGNGKEGNGKDKKISGTRFTPPSVDEVSSYCHERKNGINPQQFVDHYETNGWMRGKTKIKDWKACVRTWEQNSQPTGKEAKTLTTGVYY